MFAPLAGLPEGMYNHPFCFLISLQSSIGERRPSPHPDYRALCSPIVLRCPNISHGQKLLRTLRQHTPTYVRSNRSYSLTQSFFKAVHVCGSAHALLTPYYTSKRRTRSELPFKPADLHAKQASKRGGDCDLCVVWDEERGVVKIAGKVVRTGGGSWVYKSVDKHDPGTYVYKDGWKTSYTW